MIDRWIVALTCAGLLALGHYAREGRMSATAWLLSGDTGTVMAKLMR
jgi:hypothetical protein